MRKIIFVCLFLTMSLTPSLQSLRQVRLRFLRAKPAAITKYAPIQTVSDPNDPNLQPAAKPVVTGDLASVVKQTSTLNQISLRPIATPEHLDSMPTLQAVRELHFDDASAHRLPQVLKSAAARIGALLRQADQTPGLRQPALDALVACAEDPRIVTQVRAHCLSATVRYSIKWQQFVATSDINADEDLRDIAIGDAASELP